MTVARQRITTARLQLLAPDPAPAAGQAQAVVDFFARNRAHFAPWDPPLPPDDNAPAAVQGRLCGPRTPAAWRCWRGWASSTRAWREAASS
jgi:ribosomal-protein-alanine N-acetyltransferase